jgi:hypothetical protein
VSPRRLLAAGVGMTALGVAVAAVAPVLGTEGADRTRTQEAAGGAAVVLGWALLAWGIHRFGRVGE